MEDQIRTKIHWDIGTAYDLFISLRILHQPEEFNIRASWAAGVRSRVPLEHRQTLEQLTRITTVPLVFIHSLDKPKDSTELLKKIKQLTPTRLLEELTIHTRTPQEIQALFQTTADVSVRNQPYQLTLCIHYRSSAKTLVGNDKERFPNGFSGRDHGIIFPFMHMVSHGQKFLS